MVSSCDEVPSCVEMPSCGAPVFPPPQHLQSAQHKAYALDRNNFASIDLIIAQGISLDKFIAQERVRLLREREAAADQQK